MGLSPESVGPKGVGSRGAGNNPRLGSRDATHLLGLSPLLTGMGGKDKLFGLCGALSTIAWGQLLSVPPTDSICTVHKSTPVLALLTPR